MPPHPKGAILIEKSVRLEPLNIERLSEDLHNANVVDVDSLNLTFSPYGPFQRLDDYQNGWKLKLQKTIQLFFAIRRLTDGKAVGIASFLRINSTCGSIEVGHINYSSLLQKTKEGTEAMYLMMMWAFENGYRRYEWKFNALNLKSRYAAQRLGFSYEGVFRRCCQTNLNTCKRHIKLMIMRHRNWTNPWEQLYVFVWRIVCFLDVFGGWSGYRFDCDNC